jgi:hypothetical protein
MAINPQARSGIIVVVLAVVAVAVGSYLYRSDRTQTAAPATTTASMATGERSPFGNEECPGIVRDFDFGPDWEPVDGEKCRFVFEISSGQMQMRDARGEPYRANGFLDGRPIAARSIVGRVKGRYSLCPYTQDNFVNLDCSPKAT